MANEFYISAGLAPDDNSPAGTANTFYIAAGLIPDDVAAGATSYSAAGAMTPAGATTRVAAMHRSLSGEL